MTKPLRAEALLDDLKDPWPATCQVIEAVLAVWPDHARYAAKSLTVRDADMMQTTETLAEAALVLAGDRLATIAEHYRWTCDRLREEELFFHREGRYRLSTFAEADAEVYSNAAYMEKYMDGLLISQVLWVNHAASCHFFLAETPPLLQPGGRLLEVGPGHGLMMSLALRDFDLATATAWDLSQVSLDQTRAALEKLGHHDCTFAVQNVMDVTADHDPYDLVVLSEVLEHLEDPKSVMAPLHSLVRPETGLIFINVPINSPSPDHLYLMQTQDDARVLLTDTGFEILREGFYATQGTALERALRNKVSVSACMLAKPV
ncbi:MAG: class I SAM-dependent methyltransferase [Pseudomonadota bacterium]